MKVQGWECNKELAIFILSQLMNAQAWESECKCLQGVVVRGVPTALAPSSLPLLAAAYCHV